MRHAGCRGLQFGIAIALVLLTACQAQGQTVMNLPLMLNAARWRIDKRSGRLIA